MVSSRVKSMNHRTKKTIKREKGTQVHSREERHYNLIKIKAEIQILKGAFGLPLSLVKLMTNVMGKV